MPELCHSWGIEKGSQSSQYSSLLLLSDIILNIKFILKTDPYNFPLK